ncbi:MAG: hypothetical protein HHAS10_06750 [Candidatus Altimarinota bacterium]
MESILTTDIIRYDHPGNSGSIRSHILHPQSDITIICIISSPKQNVMSVLEDHLLECISSTEWKYNDEDTDFSYVTEKYNHFLTNLSHEDLVEIGVIFAVERNGRLMVSSIGDAEVILQEKSGTPVNIHEDTRGHHGFELISSGDIPVYGTVFVVSQNLENKVGDTFYSDCAFTESSKFIDTAREVLARDIESTTHIVRIKHTPLSEGTSSGMKSQTRKNGVAGSFFHSLKEKIRSILNTLLSHPRWRNFKEDILIFFDEKYSIILSVFLILGVILFFALTSYLVGALFRISDGTTKDAKNQIIEAKTLIESSQKLTTNPVLFDQTINKAEGILNGLESKQVYIKDIQDLRNKIEAMKKEIYDIQSIDLTDRASIVPFNPEILTPIGIYEKDKKLNIIGKQGTIQDYAIGDTGLQIKQYPSGETIKDYTIQDDGNFFFLTNSNRILASRKSAEISYINVTGQEGWENADGIATFNGNLYLWNKNEGQIYKHRPGINGFSQKSSVLPSPSEGIIDIAIDGGFYLLKNDQRIIRAMGSNGSATGLVLNNLPGGYTIGQNSQNTRIVLSGNLNYIYILDKNKVWIFLPDSKRFQDVRSWSYIAQIEFGSKDKIVDIAVPRDGLMHVLTEKAAYSIGFEFVDNNIIIH